MKRIAFFASFAALLACGNPDSTMAVREDSQTLTWDEFQALTYKEDDGVFIANGDETFETLEDLRFYYDTAIAAPHQRELGTMRGELIVDLTNNGGDNKWSTTARQNLTYCVSTKFGSRYSQVVSAMASATAEWEKYANVNFIHASNQDSNCTKSNGSVVFDVNPVNSGGRYLARAFFPDYSRRNRNILIDGSSFSQSGNPTLEGILRHELGHTLGFRHEHTRPEAGACFEDNSWRALTTYDSGSVMHYPQCNGTGNWSLTLTAKDQTGAGILYP